MLRRRASRSQLPRAAAAHERLRLAYTISAGAPALLRQMALDAAGGTTLTLRGPARARPLIGESVERRLVALARATGRRAAIRVG